MTLPVTRRAASVQSQPITLGHLGGLRDVDVVVAGGHEGADLVGDPPGVGDRWVHDVGSDAVVRQLDRRAHRVVLEGRLRRAAGDVDVMCWASTPAPARTSTCCPGFCAAVDTRP
jgi:hypothetical protein